MTLVLRRKLKKTKLDNGDILVPMSSVPLYSKFRFKGHNDVWTRETNSGWAYCKVISKWMRVEMTTLVCLVEGKF